jgi:2',3'-cyclic-nucleotide 2'-phosphodiesterase (5'-nucleotidase family)
MKKYLLFFLIILSLVISGCATAPYQKDVESQLTILYTNDHHGHLFCTRMIITGIFGKIDMVKVDLPLKKRWWIRYAKK